MEFIELTHENLEQEHICCDISSNKDPQVALKNVDQGTNKRWTYIFKISVERQTLFVQ